jgi:GNAT superfamily N-acetyltransferase
VTLDQRSPPGSGYTIEPVAPTDLRAIAGLIASAIRHSVARTEEEAEFLINDIGESLDWWLAHPSDALHLKCCRHRSIAGVILVKEFWNLTNLFVAPAHQHQGIGRQLLAHAIEACRTRSPRGALLVNSSTHATGFYERMGFRQNGPGRDLPGGCVPYRYTF